MARLLLGVSGGIAAYKAVELVRLATAAGHALRVVQTPTSLRFVGAATFEGVTGAPVLADEFERDPARGAYPGDPVPGHAPISHLELVRRCDAFVVAPASANTLAKLAGGHADNLLTTAALACTAPLVVAPAMNEAMWEHPATVANLAALVERGALVVPPESGRLASRGEWGAGRLADPAAILAAAERAIADRTARAGKPGADGAEAAGTGDAGEPGVDGPGAAGAGGATAAQAGGAGATGGRLDGLRVLVTAGGTREPIDSVRYVGNRSSGRMGVALAAEAARRGASVALVGANLAVEPPAGVETVAVNTAAELEAAARARFADCDVLLMAAAVADFRPAEPVDDKLKKAGRGTLEIRLEPTADVLAALAAERRGDQTLVGFAAEHGAGRVGEARAKLERKGLDAVVLNDVSRPEIGFDSDENEVVVVTRAGEQPVAQASKAAVASAILDCVESLRSAGEVPA